MSNRVPILRPRPIAYWWPSFSKWTRRTIEYLKKDDDYKVLISYFLSARRDVGLQKWAFEMQNAYTDKDGNYLYIFFSSLARQDKKIANRLASLLNPLGVKINADSGQSLSLNHIDSTKPFDAKYLDPRLRNASRKELEARFVDRFVDMRFDLNYRTMQGGLSRVLRLTYGDGTRLDLDYLTISDNREPAVEHASAYLKVGMANRVFPLRLNPDATPNLYNAKRSAHSRVASESNEILGVIGSGVTAYGVVVGGAFPGSGAVVPKGSLTPPLPGYGRFRGVRSTGSRATETTSIANNGIPASKPRLLPVPARGNKGNVGESVKSGSARKQKTPRVGPRKKSMSNELLEEHPHLHPKVANEAVEAAVQVEGIGGTAALGQRQGDVLLAGGVRREVTVVKNLRGVKSSLTGKVSQGADLREIYLQVGKAGDKAISTKAIRAEMNLLKAGIPGAGRVRIRVYNSKGKLVWSGVGKEPAFTP